ncbi:MAG: aspartate--ammonia ligase, partial [Erysipelotrichaceae bacterium]|nr:aspartate--ammonia ligase [Erysipelotrichaceae bacterium]
MGSFIIPKGYHSYLDLKKTELAIKHVKDFFERELTVQLNLIRVSAPLFVRPETGLNDNLNGVERPVAFDVPDVDNTTAEIVHSLAKWKRDALGRYGFAVGEGLYTDMNAIRRDEETDNIHSVYVDQWDWEKVIRKEDRNVETLMETVNAVYEALKITEKYIHNKYGIKPILPPTISFVTTQQLEDAYPDKTAREREYIYCKEHGAAFIMQIGKTLRSGKKHDGRAPDYDDWELNGDIVLWNDILDRAFEISSMGIRVDEEAMARQLKLAGAEERAEMDFHKKILNKELPYTIGGGIGQSRLCMYFLRKA